MHLPDMTVYFQFPRSPEKSRRKCDAASAPAHDEQLAGREPANVFRDLAPVSQH